MPTRQQLQQYADQLPPIYRDILKAFHHATSPVRAYGEGVSANVLLVELTNQGFGYAVPEVYAALEQLEESGFVDVGVDHLMHVEPTPLGEELLEVLTGRPVPKVAVPTLPKPTW